MSVIVSTYIAVPDLYAKVCYYYMQIIGRLLDVVYAALGMHC